MYTIFTTFEEQFQPQHVQHSLTYNDVNGLSTQMASDFKKLLQNPLGYCHSNLCTLVKKTRFNAPYYTGATS